MVHDKNVFSLGIRQGVEFALAHTDLDQVEEVTAHVVEGHVEDLGELHHLVHVDLVGDLLKELAVQVYLVYALIKDVLDL